MKCSPILTVIAVLACVSAASADNLPPVPPATVTTDIASTGEPAKTLAIEQSSCSLENAPLPPAPGETDCEANAEEYRRCPMKKAMTVLLVNRFIRRPIYQARKTFHDLKVRRWQRKCRRFTASECRQADPQQRVEKHKANCAEVYRFCN